MPAQEVVDDSPVVAVDVEAAAFAEGHYMQIEVAGILKSSANKPLARKFLAFMTGPGFQDHIPTNNWMWPAGNLNLALSSAALTRSLDSLTAVSGKPTSDMLGSPPPM